MNQEYIVLRTKPPIASEAGGPGMAMATAAAPPPLPTLEEVSLSEAERADLRRDLSVQAIAPPMPMKLIEPVDFDSGPDAQPAAGTPTWGVAAVRADASPFDGSGITVAVLDTGIDPNHDAFQGINLIRRNFTNEGDDDTHGHGTHCAGTIFGREVQGQRIGVAPGVNRVLIAKVLGAGGGNSGTIANAINWALENGAHVISMSLGIDFPGFVDFLVNNRGLDINPATSIALEGYRANVNLFSSLATLVAARQPFGQGSVIVAASGNESDRPNFEIAVAPPAAGTGVVAVGALEEDSSGFSVARFSNNQVDIAGPGVAVVSAKAGGGLRSLSGTSMATPHAAGVAALWAQRMLDSFGRVEASTVTAQLIGRADISSLASGFSEDQVGTGIVQAPLS